MQVIDWGRILFSITLLSYGSISDLKTREVSNTVWVVGFPIGAVFTVASSLIEFNPDTLVMTVASITVSSLLALALFYLNLFGGADAKALIFISLCTPLYPREGFTPLNLRGIDPILPFFPISVFNNSLILSVSVVVFVLLKNFFSAFKGKPVFKGVEVRGFHRKALLVATSYRARVEDLMGKAYLYPAEKPLEVSGAVIRRPTYFMKAEAEKADLMRGVEVYAAKGLYVDGVLVTPTIPMIVFITLGMLTALYGDLIVLIALRTIGV